MLWRLLTFRALRQYRSAPMTAFDLLPFARAIHVLAVVHWIGGVAAVTTIILPLARACPDPVEALAVFARFERRFAYQARFSVALVGLSGAYMLWAFNAWSRFLELSSWWLHLMVAVWVVFATMLFILEPLVLHAFFAKQVMKNKERAFSVALGLHVFALVVSAVAIVAGVLGAHGAIG